MGSRSCRSAVFPLPRTRTRHRALVVLRPQPSPSRTRSDTSWPVLKQRDRHDAGRRTKLCPSRPASAVPLHRHGKCRPQPPTLSTLWVTRALDEGTPRHPVMPSEAPRDRDEGRNRGPSRYLDHGYRSRSQPRYYVQRNARANAPRAGKTKARRKLPRGRMNDCSEPQAVQWTFCNPGHRYMECEFQLLRGSFLKNGGSDLRSSTFCWVPESEPSHSPRQRIVVL